MPREVQSRGYGKKPGGKVYRKPKPAPKPRSFNRQISKQISTGVKRDKARPKAAPYSMLDKAHGKPGPKYATKKYVKRAGKQTKEFHKQFLAPSPRLSLKEERRSVYSGKDGHLVHPDWSGYVDRSRLANYHGYGKQDSKALAFGLKALEQTARPIHGIAGGAKAAIEGKNVPKAALRGVELKDHHLFSDVLKVAGVKNKAVRAVAGFGLDLAADPTSYASLGLASPVRKLATKEGERVAKKAADKGMSEAGQATVRKAAEKRVLASKPHTRGVTIGTRKYRTSGRATAFVARKTGAARAGKAAHDFKGTQAAGEAAAPAFVAKGVPREAAHDVHRAESEARAQMDVAQRKIAARARAYHKKHGQEDYHRILDAIETGHVGRLKGQNPELHTSAVRLRSDLRHMARTEQHAGLLPKTRKDYVPHIRRQDVEDVPTSLGGTRVKGSATSGYARERKLAGTLKEWDMKDPSLFTRDLPTIYGQRAAAGARDQARAHVVQAAVKHARRLTPKATWDTATEAVYKLGGHKGSQTKLEKLEGDSKIKGSAIEAAMRSPQERVAAQKELSQLRARLAKAREARRTPKVSAEELKNLEKIAADAEANAAAQHATRSYKFGLANAVHMERIAKDARAQIAAARAKGAGKAENPEVLHAKITALRESMKHHSGQHVILPKKLADDIMARQNPAEISALHAWYRKQHGRYKTVLTQLMPSYHLRNLYGDSWNASLKQHPGRLAVNMGRSARMLKVERGVKKGEKEITLSGKGPASQAGTKVPGEGKVPYSDLLARADQTGGRGSGFSRELTEMVQKGEGKLRNVGQSRENLVRTATWLGAKKEGLSDAAAAQRVRDLHIDYADLTKAERSVRDVLPFYTFAARNTPIQAKALLSHPGKLARYQKVIEEGGKAAGLPDDWQYNLKDYQQLGQAVPLFGAMAGGKKALGLPGLPTTDLNRLDPNPKEQFRQVASMLTGLKTVGELLVSDEGYSLFFKGPIDTGNKVAAPDWAHILVDQMPDGKVKDAIGLEYAMDRASGKKIWKWNPKTDYVLKQLPETSFLLGITSTGKNRRGQDKTAKTIKLSGVSIEPYDPDAVAKDRLYADLKKVTNRVKQLNAQGVYADKSNAEYDRLAAKREKIQGRIDKIALRQKARGEPVKLPRRLEESGGTVGDLVGGGKSRYEPGTVGSLK